MMIYKWKIVSMSLSPFLLFGDLIGSSIIHHIGSRNVVLRILSPLLHNTSIEHLGNIIIPMKTRSKKTRPLSHALEASGTENRQPFQDVTNTTNAACNMASQSTEATVAQSQFLAVIPEWDGCSPDQIMKRLKLLEEEELQKLGI